MDSPLLRRLFSRALRASLASPLVIAGCGSVDLTGYSAPACEGTVPAVSGLSPTAPVDFVQLRNILRSWDGGYFQESASASSGTACATASDPAACQSALESLSSRSGFRESCADPACRWRLIIRGRAGGHHDPGARAQGARRREGAAIAIEEHAVRRMEAARRRRGDHRRRPDAVCQPGGGTEAMSRRDEIREKALKDLQQYQVLMIDGHFDFGNGYHGRVYLNPHQLFRYPSTIWRFAQDLLDVLPASVVDDTEVVAGPVTGGALLAHTVAGLLDSRRPMDSPRTMFAPFGVDQDCGQTMTR